jgi:hypothetical protein
MRNDRNADQIISEYFQRIKEGPQVISDPLDSQATGGTIGEALKPEQQKLAQKFAAKFMQMALQEHELTSEDWEKVCGQLIVASEKAEGEDASDVEI